MNFERIKNIAVDVINEIYDEEYSKMPPKIVKIGTKKIITPKPKAQVKLISAKEYGFKPVKSKRGR